MTIWLHCRDCDHFWRIPVVDWEKNTRCPECGGVHVYGDEPKEQSQKGQE